jgi:hypothetical protein
MVEDLQAFRLEFRGTYCSGLSFHNGDSLAYDQSNDQLYYNTSGLLRNPDFPDQFLKSRVVSQKIKW